MEVWKGKIIKNWKINSETTKNLKKYSRNKLKKYDYTIFLQEHKSFKSCVFLIDNWIFSN